MEYSRVSRPFKICKSVGCLEDGILLRSDRQHYDIFSIYCTASAHLFPCSNVGMLAVVKGVVLPLGALKGYLYSTVQRMRRFSCLQGIIGHELCCFRLMG